MLDDRPCGVTGDLVDIRHRGVSRRANALLGRRQFRSQIAFHLLALRIRLRGCAFARGLSKSLGLTSGIGHGLFVRCGGRFGALLKRRSIVNVLGDA